MRMRSGRSFATGRLLILKKGNVAIVKEDKEIAKVAEPGAIFGELSVLLDQPHTADVRALETSQFYIADATALLAQDPIAVLCVATVLAHRLNGANHGRIQLKNQLETGEPHNVVAKTVSRMEGLLAIGGASLIHAIRLHDYRRLIVTLTFFAAILDAGYGELLAAAGAW